MFWSCIEYWRLSIWIELLVGIKPIWILRELKGYGHSFINLEPDVGSGENFSIHFSICNLSNQSLIEIYCSAGMWFRFELITFSTAKLSACSITIQKKSSNTLMHDSVWYTRMVSIILNGLCVSVCVMCVWTSATIRGRNHVWKYSFIFNCVLGLLLKEQISVIFLAHSLLHLFYIEILKAKHEICTHSNSDYTFKHPHVILFFFLLRHVRTHWNVENSELWIYRKLPNFEYVDWL